MPSIGRRPWLERSWSCVLLACLAGLSTLAHASPPDPLWIPGIYDAADYDDAIALLTSAEATEDAPAPTTPVVPVVERVPSPLDTARGDASLLSVHLRSPPTA